MIQTKFDGGNLLVGLTIGWQSMVCLAVIVILFKFLVTGDELA